MVYKKTHSEKLSKVKKKYFQKGGERYISTFITDFEFIPIHSRILLRIHKADFPDKVLKIKRFAITY